MNWSLERRLVILLLEQTNESVFKQFFHNHSQSHDYSVFGTFLVLHFFSHVYFLDFVLPSRGGWGKETLDWIVFVFSSEFQKCSEFRYEIANYFQKNARIKVLCRNKSKSVKKSSWAKLTFASRRSKISSRICCLGSGHNRNRVQWSLIIQIFHQERDSRSFWVENH